MYNAECKEEFLKLYPLNSQITYRSVLEKSKHIEHHLAKDMYEFDLNDFEYFFNRLNIDYTSTARSYGRICTKYVDWAIQKGFTQKHNPLRKVKTKWFEQFVSEETKIYFTELEMRYIEEACVNPQDAVISRLIFEGVQGRAVSEIRNLRKSDVNFKTGEILLLDEDGTSRTLLVTERCLELIQKAIDQKKYTKSNGNMEERDNILQYTELLESEFVIRNSNTGKDKNIGAVDKYVIYRRISSIEKQLGLKHFNIKNISRSGVLKFVRDRLIIGQSINLVSLIFVANDFKMKTSTLRNFVSKENINKLYGDSF
jgi:integrase